MAATRYRLLLGASAASVVVEEGATIPGGNAVSVNFDAGKLRRLHAIGLLRKVRKSIHQGKWPPVDAGPAIPSVAVSVTGSLAEGGTMTVTVTASQASASAMSVDIAVSGRGASPLNAADFGGTFPTWSGVTIAAGQISATRTFATVDDADVEPDEGGRVTISNPVNCNLGGATADFTVLNNDDAGVQFWPYSWVQAGDVGTWGSSSISGLAGASIASFIAADAGSTALVPGSVPASGPPVAIQGGVGNDGGGMILARVIAASARCKAAPAAIQMCGNATNDAIPANQTLAKVHFEITKDIVGAGGLNHSNFVLAAKHPDRATGAVGRGWLIPQEYLALAEAHWPGKTTDVGLVIRQLEAVTADDITDRDIDRQMLTYSNDASHMNAVGQQYNSRYTFQPFFDALDGGLPWVGHRKVFSKEPTNQTNDGLVATLPVVGSQAGVTWTVEGSTLFSAVANGSNVEIRRANGTLALDAPYRVRLRATRDGKSRDTLLELYLLETTPVYRGAARVRGEKGAAKDTIDPTLANRSGQIISFALVVRPVSGDGANRMLMSMENNGQRTHTRGLSCLVANNNQFDFRLRNAAGVLVGRAETSGNAAQKITAANGKRLIVGKINLVTGTGHCAVDRNAVTAANTATLGETFEICPVVLDQELYWLNSDSAGFAAETEWSAFAMWEADIDWSVLANRDLVADLSNNVVLHTARGENAPGQIGGVDPFVWVQGNAANWAVGYNHASGNQMVRPYSRWAHAMETV